MDGSFAELRFEAAAITAVAHKLARLLYQTLKRGALPARETAAAYAARQREQAVATLRKKALRLGLRVVATGELVESVASPP